MTCDDLLQDLEGLELAAVERDQLVAGANARGLGGAAGHHGLDTNDVAFRAAVTVPVALPVTVLVSQRDRHRQQDSHRQECSEHAAHLRNRYPMLKPYRGLFSQPSRGCHKL